MMTPIALECQPVRMDHRIEDFIRSAFNVKVRQGVPVPDYKDLKLDYLRQQFVKAYGRNPEPGELKCRISAHDRELMLTDIPAFRHLGYVFRRYGNYWVGIAESSVSSLNDGQAPLGRAAETAALYILHKWHQAYRASRTMEVEIDLRAMRLHFDPTRTDPNAVVTLRQAVRVLSATTFCIQSQDLDEETIVPLMKCTSISRTRPVIRVALNEYFVGCLVRLVPENSGLKKKERAEKLGGIRYFQDNETRMIVRNLPPAYTRTQAKLQLLLFTGGWKTHTTRVLRKPVRDWLADIGYQDQKTRVGRFLNDLQRVIEDANGIIEPDLGSLRAMGAAVMDQTLEVKVPVDFAVNQYPRLIEDKAGIVITGEQYDPFRSRTQEVKAVLARGYTGGDLQDLRERLGITQHDLAGACGISKRTLIRLENKTHALEYPEVEKIWRGLTACPAKPKVTGFSEVASKGDRFFRSCIPK